MGLPLPWEQLLDGVESQVVVKNRVKEVCFHPGHEPDVTNHLDSIVDFG